MVTQLLYEAPSDSHVIIARPSFWGMGLPKSPINPCKVAQSLACRMEKMEAQRERERERERCIYIYIYKYKMKVQKVIGVMQGSIGFIYGSWIRV